MPKPDGSTKRIRTRGRPNSLIYHHGYLWFCDSGCNAIRRMNLRAEVIETGISHVSGQPLNRPNDLFFDDKIILIITCPGIPDGGEEGYVVVYSSKGFIEIIAEGLLYPNGLALFLD